MKKIILITFVLLIFISVANSRTITLKECYTDISGEKSFNRNVYEDYNFVIDTNKKILTYIYVWNYK